MSYVVNDKYFTGNEPYVERIYPPNCLPNTVEQTWSPQLKSYFDRSLSNDLDSRPRPPPDPLTGVMPQTNQALQYTYTAKGPACYSVSHDPCPHAGTHGMVENRVYTWYSPAGKQFQPPDFDKWSLSMRQKIDEEVVNLGTTLAEYRASARMFGSFAEGVYNTFQIMRGWKRRRKIKPCSIAASHLQYSYGISPLANDLFDSAEALKLRLGRPIFRRYVVTGGDTFNYEQHSLGYRVKGTSKVSQRAIIYATFDPNAFLQTGGFSIGNPVEWAWELIPFSFVVDWGIPIGEWLHSLDALRGVSRVTGSLTTKEWDTYRSSIYDGRTEISQGSFSYNSHKRDVINSIPIPPLPRYEPSQSLRTIANGLALLTAVNKRCKGPRKARWV